MATYPDNSITFQSSSMVLLGHSDASYINVRKACSRAAAHIMLSEDAPIPPYNGPVLKIAQIIKGIMSSATEYELTDLYICGKKMVPLREALVEIG